MTLRVCKKCNDEKNLTFFLKKKNKKGEYYFLYTCLECNRKYNKSYSKTYYLENKDKLIEDSKSWYKSNLDKKKEYDKEYIISHKCEKKEYDIEYRKKNKSSINKRLSQYRKNRRQHDLSYSLRKNISNSVWYYLKLNNASKNGESCFKYLPYTIKELKEHLEKQFESWMTWKNYGDYRSDIWVDDDRSTWKWNLDHIIPQSKLLYISMEDENFKKCWALENLRPLSAKHNLLKSNTYEEEIK